MKKTTEVAKKVISERFEVQVTGYKSNYFETWGDKGVFCDTYEEAAEMAREYASKTNGGEYPPFTNWHARVVKVTKTIEAEF